MAAARTRRRARGPDPGGPADAGRESSPDASAVVVTVFQLGQVVAIATLGSLYLWLADAPGAVVSAHAYSPTATGLAVAAVAAGGCAAVLSARLTEG